MAFPPRANPGLKPQPDRAACRAVEALLVIVVWLWVIDRGKGGDSSTP